VGNRTRVTVKKNKVAPPFRVAEFDIMYNEGISTAGDLIDLGVSQEILTKRGAFYSYGDLRLGQGREAAKAFLDQNPELSAEIDGVIRAAVGVTANLEVEAEEGADDQGDDMLDVALVAGQEAGIGLFDSADRVERAA
jgi:recombination protein RecA